MCEKKEEIKQVGQAEKNIVSLNERIITQTKKQNKMQIWIKNLIFISLLQHHPVAKYTSFPTTPLNIATSLTAHKIYLHS